MPKVKSSKALRNTSQESMTEDEYGRLKLLTRDEFRLIPVDEKVSYYRRLRKEMNGAKEQNQSMDSNDITWSTSEIKSNNMGFVSVFYVLYEGTDPFHEDEIINYNERIHHLGFTGRLIRACYKTVDPKTLNLPKFYSKAGTDISLSVYNAKVCYMDQRSEITNKSAHIHYSRVKDYITSLIAKWINYRGQTLLVHHDFTTDFKGHRNELFGIERVKEVLGQTKKDKQLERSYSKYLENYHNS